MAAGSIAKLNNEHQLIIITIGSTALMSSLDSTIVNITLPTLSRYFDVNIDIVSWVSLSYLLTMSGLLMAFGKLGDILGFKKIFLWGSAVFTMGSFLCSISTNIDILIAFRVIQGIGGSMLMAIGPAMVFVFLPEDIRGKALGYISTATALGIALGPMLGGFLTVYMGWKWVFLVNIPFGIGAILLGSRMLHEDTRHLEEGPFDLAGAGMLFFMIAIPIYALSISQDIGWRSPIIIGILAATILSISAFLFCEHHCPSPIMDLTMFRNHSFTLAAASGSLVFLIFNGALFLLPFYLEHVMQVRTDVAGLIMAVPAVSMMIFAPTAGKLSDHYGSRMLCSATSLICALSLIIFSTLGSSSPIYLILLGLAILGLGVGMFSSPNSRLIMAQSHANVRGMASSLMMVGRRAGSALGVAIFGTIFSETLYLNGMIGHVHSAVPNVLTSGFQASFMVVVLICMVAIVMSIMARD